MYRLGATGSGRLRRRQQRDRSGSRLADHVFVNRGVTIGHDTHVGSFSRIQPGANLGGLSRIGVGVTVAIGATLLERLVIGDGAFVGAGAVATEDVPDGVLVLESREVQEGFVSRSLARVDACRQAASSAGPDASMSKCSAKRWRRLSPISLRRAESSVRAARRSM